MISEIRAQSATPELIEIKKFYKHDPNGRPERIIPMRADFYKHKDF